MADVNYVDPGSLAEAQRAFDAGMASAHEHDNPVEVGTPVVAPMRQARPVEQWGMGYREAAPEGAVH